MNVAEAAILLKYIHDITGQDVADSADAWADVLDDVDVRDAREAVRAIARRPQPHDRRLAVSTDMVRAEVAATRKTRIEHAYNRWEPTSADPAEYLRQLRAAVKTAGDGGELEAPHQKPTIGHRRDDIMRRAQQAIETI